MSYFQLLWDQTAEINNVLNLRPLSISLAKQNLGSSQMWVEEISLGADL